MSLTKLRLGGVPEHFNLPVHLAIEKGEFAERGIDLEWITYNGGTGQMTKAMRNGEVDACILLTEGIIADILNGNPSKIISNYVNTALTWGIHTGSNNPLSAYADIFSKTYGISRFGSGSHLMAIVNADSEGHKLKEEQFKVIKNLDGALESLVNLETDVFYWEKYTTKPYVDNGQLRRVGEYVTPWPCFVVAATDKVIAEQPNELIRMLRTIHDSSDMFMQDQNSIQQVSEKYNQKLLDVERWFTSTEWAIHGWVSERMIANVIYHLQLAGITDKSADNAEIIWKR
jgi:ABC-type nitrate/sulfonate/bicarbonate transport system substrate-binding protein